MKNNEHRIGSQHHWDNLRHLLKEKLNPQPDGDNQKHSTEEYWDRLCELTGKTREQFQSQFRKY